ncbi:MULTISPECIES: hypothetical protein [unclassified Mesorhizobium]|uniref:hypothetical protein n=1 Tax=unclassified Mesorhizobium TaxID=325217 RepID=UPI000FD52FAF|nr:MULTISPECIES: hypothetical protein [unclassified Mesorhizobium]RVB76887.1 hypothetical protein EN885_14760 [Mesorhizobium sp. M6A.T.Cr.TU.014.01.1.1]RWP78047.1 MAG: hypothetical protein EOR10_13720 [Mesorhizobium sp.]RWQ05746.1 MAG: hypothetical protein EOR90_13925 [Mesorhizobium sp.]RWQ07149.1 MAG: hypothetical protein EOR91_12990 [Mesorhizobium sp.]
MIRTGFSLAILLIGTIAVSAALPPFWQRKAEIQAILDSGALAGVLERRGPIDAVERVGNDHYRVRAGGCALDVLIVDDASAAVMPGPRKFLLKLGELVCK